MHAAWLHASGKCLNLNQLKLDNTLHCTIVMQTSVLLVLPCSQPEGTRYASHLTLRTSWYKSSADVLDRVVTGKRCAQHEAERFVHVAIADTPQVVHLLPPRAPALAGTATASSATKCLPVCKSQHQHGCMRQCCNAQPRCARSCSYIQCGCGMIRRGLQCEASALRSALYSAVA